MFQSKIIRATLAGAVAAGIATTAFADEWRKAAALRSAKISLVQAITAAEQHTGGKAIDGDLDSRYGIVAYKVKVITDHAVKKVFVDPDTGKVLRVAYDD